MTVALRLTVFYVAVSIEAYMFGLWTGLDDRNIHDVSRFEASVAYIKRVSPCSQIGEPQMQFVTGFATTLLYDEA